VAAVATKARPLTREEKIEKILILEEQDRRKARKSFYSLFPDATTTWEGPKTGVFQHGRGETIFARDLYPKHLEFFAVGKSHRERCLMAANRVGKTIAGGYEDAAHLTGEYPTWWTGYRFKRPTDGWAAGKTNETTRDIVQKKLLGEITWRGSEKTVTGTGVIPGDLIGDITWKQGVQDFVDTVKIKHVPTGEWSNLGFKSYQQGRGAFEGTEKDFIHLDEEPPEDIYGECLIRTATTNGRIYLTFTPLDGLSDVVISFLPTDMLGGQ
jgi:phage terminase large subunit-like protein